VNVPSDTGTATNDQGSRHVYVKNTTTTIVTSTIASGAS